MKKPKFSLLSDFKKLDWNRQRKIILIVLGVLALILFAVILGFCSSGEEKPPEASEPEEIAEEEPAEPDIYFITAHASNNVNVRKEPSVNSERVFRIPAGDTSIRLLYSGESVYKEEFIWHNVILPDGGNGWVREDVVIIDEMNEEPDEG